MFLFVCRQLIVDTAADLFTEMMSAYSSGDKIAVQKHADKITGLLVHLADKVLNVRWFSLDLWLNKSIAMPHATEQGLLTI